MPPALSRGGKVWIQEMLSQTVPTATSDLKKSSTYLHLQRDFGDFRLGYELLRHSWKRNRGCLNLFKRASTEESMQTYVLKDEWLVSMELLVWAIIFQELQGLEGFLFCVLFLSFFIHLFILLLTAPGQLFYPLWVILGIMVSFFGFYFSWFMLTT